MQRAGYALYEHIKNKNDVLIVTGAGNNAGDGFILASLLHDKGLNVDVWALTPPSLLSGDAYLAAKGFIDRKGNIIDKPVKNYHIIIDALFGTGLNRKITGKFAAAIEWINQHNNILSVDIPSGLNADTGCIEGVAVNAHTTITMICHKPGMHTLHGKDSCGHIILAELTQENTKKMPRTITPVAQLLDKKILTEISKKNSHHSHKGSFGHLIVAGGSMTMPGAVLLAAKAALRSGCGSVTTLSHPQNAFSLPLTLPEIMSQAYSDKQKVVLKKTPHVAAIGMGMGQSQWSHSMYRFISELNIPCVIDADGLLYARQNPDSIPANSILTPHPGEAAMLLNTSVEKIQYDRIKSCQKISLKYNSIVVLKGSGTVISDGNNHYICPYGSSNLATAGSGDVLSGIIASLMAQGYHALQAANTGVVWHAISGENSIYKNTTIASDIIEELYQHI